MENKRERIWKLQLILIVGLSIPILGVTSAVFSTWSIILLMFAILIVGGSYIAIEWFVDDMIREEEREKQEPLASIYTQETPHKTRVEKNHHKNQADVDRLIKILEEDRRRNL